MKRVERTATVGAPPETLFAYLADLGNLNEWMPGIVSAEVTSPGAIGVGTTARVVRSLGGQQVAAPLAVAEYDPPRHLVITTEVSGVGVAAAARPVRRPRARSRSRVAHPAAMGARADRGRDRTGFRGPAGTPSA